MKRYNNDNNKVLLDDNIKGADVILEFMKIYDLNDWDDIYDLFKKKKSLSKCWSGFIYLYSINCDFDFYFDYEYVNETEKLVFKYDKYYKKNCYFERKKTCKSYNKEELNIISRMSKLNEILN